MSYMILKWLHVIGATALLGTGAGIAFFLARAHRTQDARVIAAVAGDVVLADFVFTSTAVMLQPVTGFLMMAQRGWTFAPMWLRGSVVLYVLVGCCWLPVVWLQWRMRNMARAAAAAGEPLPPLYFTFYRRWSVLGWPAFAGVLGILWLMIARPQ